mmetsp:Transcript_63815/g.134405  ORF Transcript_63815/g.134405 Transcript_63815/m.134405 type:complete len:291 (+) Transcript_63815:279-1151(+)
MICDLFGAAIARGLLAIAIAQEVEILLGLDTHMIQAACQEGVLTHVVVVQDFLACVVSALEILVHGPDGNDLDCPEHPKAILELAVLEVHIRLSTVLRCLHILTNLVLQDGWHEHSVGVQLHNEILLHHHSMFLQLIKSSGEDVGVGEMSPHAVAGLQTSKGNRLNTGCQLDFVVGENGPFLAPKIAGFQRILFLHQTQLVGLRSDNAETEQLRPLVVGSLLCHDSTWQRWSRTLGRRRWLVVFRRQRGTLLLHFEACPRGLNLFWIRVVDAHFARLKTACPRPVLHVAL